MADVLPTRSAIAASQLRQLRALLSALTPANRFYTEKFQAAGCPNPVTSLEEFSRRFPFTSKLELMEDQQRHPPYGTNLTFPLERYARCHQTSGSKGTPIRWLDTPESWSWMLDHWERIYCAAGVTRADRVFFAFSFGPFIGFWLAFEAAARLGCFCLPGGGLSSVARLRAIFDHGATALCCTPTYALRLAEVAAEEKMDLSGSRVRVIIVAGEPGGSIPATRHRLEQLWPGARIFDHHGMTETGPVTYECPARPGVLHVLESGYLAEVIDPATTRPVAPGDTGELVLTNLGRVGSPLLRYRTGDLVRPNSPAGISSGKPCACGGFAVALAGGILGRTDDMVAVRGVNIYPSAVEDIIRDSGRVAEFQVQISTQQSLTELVVRIEPIAECREVNALVRQLEKAFQLAFALRVPVRAVAPGTLPRFEMKAQRWMRI